MLKMLPMLLICLLFSGQAMAADDAQKIPEPATWKFPEIVELARKLVAQNLEGRSFNQYGIAYSAEELHALPVASMRAAELEKYADIVTYAYPDAVFARSPHACKEIPIDRVNQTTMGNIAYISIRAVKTDAREQAAECLHDIQANMQKSAE